MKYHVVFTDQEAGIYEGAGEDPEHTYDTFDEAKAVAIADLEDKLEAVQTFLKMIRDAQSMKDLTRYKS